MSVLTGGVVVPNPNPNPIENNLNIGPADVVEKCLKVTYGDGMKSLLVRPGSGIKEVPFHKVEGKAYNFSSVAGRGGAVSGNFLNAKRKAGEKGLQAEYSVEPGALWASYTVLKTELVAAKSNLGAYMPVFKRDFYRATTALRQTLSMSLYGRGYGEIAVLGTAITSASVDDIVDIAMDKCAATKLDVDSEIVIKATIGTAEESATNEAIVTGLLPGYKGVRVKITKAGTSPAGSVICLKGSTVPGTTKPILPLGLDAWLPIAYGRENPAGTTSWDSFIGTNFCGQNRSAAVDRMCGGFYKPASSSEKIYEALENALFLDRMQGGNGDIILMNMEDRAALAQQLQNAGTQYMSSTESTKSRKVNVGIEQVGVTQVTNFIDFIVDDVDCPKGKFYIGDRSAWEMLIWASKQDQNKNDGISTLEPGKEEPEGVDAPNFDDYISKLNIDDYITIQDGVDTWRGPGVSVHLGFIGSLAVTDTSAWVVGLIPASDYSTVLGYSS